MLSNSNGFSSGEEASKAFRRFTETDPYSQKLKQIQQGFVVESASEFPGGLKASDVRRIRNFVGKLVIELGYLDRLPDRQTSPQLSTACLCINGAIDRLNEFLG